MPKPLGIAIGMKSNGAPHMYVTGPDRLIDAIWDVVQDCIIAGMTPEQFKKEAANAWAHELRNEADRARKILAK